MNLKPFSYGMELLKVYDDGVMIDPSVFNSTLDEILGFF